VTEETLDFRLLPEDERKKRATNELSACWKHLQLLAKKPPPATVPLDLDHLYFAKVPKITGARAVDLLLNIIDDVEHYFDDYDVSLHITFNNPNTLLLLGGNATATLTLETTTKTTRNPKKPPSVKHEIFTAYTSNPLHEDQIALDGRTAPTPTRLFPPRKNIYHRYKQSPITNDIIPGFPQFPVSVSDTGTALIADHENEWKLNLLNYNQLIGNRVYATAVILLECLIIQATSNGISSKMTPEQAIIRLPLARYKELRGLTGKNDDELRAQVKRDITAIEAIRFEYLRKHKKIRGEKKRPDEWCRIGVYGGRSELINGVIAFRFSPEFLESIHGNYGHYMQYPASALRADPVRHPYTLFFGRRLTLHYRMNMGSANQNIIKVSTLLEACRVFPKYEDVKITDGAVGKRMITPFERDMNALEPELIWQWMGDTPETYAAFEEASIWFEFQDHPETTKLEKQKQARKKRIKSAAEKRDAKNAVTKRKTVIQA